MTPENQFNPLGLSARESASVVGGLPSAPSEPPTQEVNPVEMKMQEVLNQFRTHWIGLEKINGEYGGDSEKFTNMQKAVESWLSDIVTKLPESAQM